MERKKICPPKVNVRPPPEGWVSARDQASGRGSILYPPIWGNSGRLAGVGLLAPAVDGG